MSSCPRNVARQNNTGREKCLHVRKQKRVQNLWYTIPHRQSRDYLGQWVVLYNQTCFRHHRISPSSSHWSPGHLPHHGLSWEIKHLRAVFNLENGVILLGLKHTHTMLRSGQSTHESVTTVVNSVRWWGAKTSNTMQALPHNDSSTKYSVVFNILGGFWSSDGTRRFGHARLEMSHSPYLPGTTQPLQYTVLFRLDYKNS